MPPLGAPPVRASAYVHAARVLALASASARQIPHTALHSRLPGRGFASVSLLSQSSFSAISHPRAVRIPNGLACVLADPRGLRVSGKAGSLEEDLGSLRGVRFISIGEASCFVLHTEGTLLVAPFRTLFLVLSRVTN